MLAPTLSDTIALADRMVANPADSVTLAPQLADAIRLLPPSRAELLSRPVFQRASLWSLAVSFERLDPGVEGPPQVIRAQHDVWIRGVQAQVYLAPEVTEAVNNLDALRRLRRVCGQAGSNLRGLVEVNWRLDGRQGFISTGQAEILARGTSITGDGFWSSPLDWQLQKDQTIEVRARARSAEFLPLIPGNITPLDQQVRWLVVSFWAEEMRQPSTRV
jgi:hypothetical protein